MAKALTIEQLKNFINAADDIVFKTDIKTAKERIVEVSVGKKGEDIKFDLSTTYVFRQGGHGTKIYKINAKTGEKQEVKFADSEEACSAIAAVLWRYDQLIDLEQENTKKAEQKAKTVRASVVKKAKENTL